MAGTIEAARVLTQYSFPTSVAYLGLSGEEQGLFGGRFLANDAVEAEWDIAAVLNNDMIGNIEGIDGVIENNTFRIFSEATPATDTEDDYRRRRFYGGEVDGPSRQLARYIARIADTYIPNLDPILIYADWLFIICWKVSMAFSSCTFFPTPKRRLKRTCRQKAYHFC